MLRIGLVDLDTSHPGSWTPILRELGHEVIGVYDSGAVYPAGYAREFADRHGIGRVYDSLEQMAHDVDTAIVHSCNWDVHVDRARPFLSAGKSVLLDKPLAGHMKDVLQLLRWAGEGYRITGGSSLRYAEEVARFRELSADEIGEPLFLYGGCAVDDFNYGIHAYSLAHGLLGPGIDSVRHLGSHGQHLTELVWEDGKRAVLAIGGTAGYQPFYATLTCSKTIHHIQVDSSRIYKSFLTRVLPYLAGEVEAPPVPLEQLLEVEMAALAVKQSRANGGTRVLLRELTEHTPGYDGQAFAHEYRLQKMNR
ncbi:Gfo/Idh/MocA family protein [Paenibacillus sp. HJGM_3]|uniref:Gfo/Idh/MocA family protein n=1 Tax=Paenibacillus sp. HJGM_3 TaxID=3379816 RepID=UPI00385B6AA0